MHADRHAGASAAHRHLAIDEAWLRLREEAPLEPRLPIVDAHHHLWDRSRAPRYMLDDLLADIGGQHRIVGTVFVESRAAWRADGPAAFRPVGETEFANGVAALSASGEYGDIRVCAGIVATLDLRAAEAGMVIEAHLAAGGGRLRGVRQIAARHDSPDVRVSGSLPPAGLLADPAFRRGYALLGAAGLGFDAWVYHPQLNEVASLADAFPGTQVILDHTGGPIGIGPYRGRRDAAFAEWHAGMRALALRPNVAVKLGGLGMKLGGFDFHRQDRPPSSAQLAEAWKPYIDACIDAFGPGRCMFESNFPVEKGSCSYGILWNAFKRIASGASRDEKDQLFARTAARIYRLQGLSSAGAERAAWAAQHKETQP